MLGEQPVVLWGRAQALRHWHSSIPSSGTPRRHSVGTEPQHTEGAGGAQRFSLEA